MICSFKNGICRECGNAQDADGSPFCRSLRPKTAGFYKRVKNFAAAAVSHVAAGMPMASDEDIVRRHDICLACERLIDGACADCGCPVSRVRSFISKLSWADQECPRGKWGKAKNSH